MESVHPDFTCLIHEDAEKLDFIHRKTSGSDIYFVRNKTMDPVKTECIFRVKNWAPQIWDQGDGSIKDQFVCKSDKEGTELTINLPPGGAIFVVFIDRADAGLQKNFDVKDLAEPLTLKGDWTVKFDSKWGAPEEIKLPELISWTDHASDGVKYYSGTGTYFKTINVSANWLEPGHFVNIDLGNVRELAEIFVNGQSAGVLWKPPFRTEITSLLKAGKNELKIEVVNLWINRLTGDIKLPDNQKYTKTNIRSDGATPKVKAEPWHVEPSGLLGPVRLIPSLNVRMADNGIHRSEKANQSDIK